MSSSSPPPQNPKVSVIIPVYNAEKFVAATLQSLLEQTYPHFEALIVDDGSPDRSVEICRRFKDPRVKIIQQENQGLPGARNTGIRHATGDLIAFLDADDLWVPTKLATHVQHFNQDPELGVSFARIEFMQFDGQLTGQSSHVRLNRITPQHLYKENLLCTPSNVMMRRPVLEQVGGFDETLKAGYEDLELFVRISCHSWKIEGLDQVLVHYRTSAAGMSAQLQKMESAWYCFSDRVNHYAPTLITEHYRPAKAMLLRYLARRSLRLQVEPSIGTHFINRSLLTDWTLLLREPRRTLLTMAAVYAQHVLLLANSRGSLAKE